MLQIYFIKAEDRIWKIIIKRIKVKAKFIIHLQKFTLSQYKLDVYIFQKDCVGLKSRKI